MNPVLNTFGSFVNQTGGTLSRAAHEINNRVTTYAAVTGLVFSFYAAYGERSPARIMTNVVTGLGQITLNTAGSARSFIGDRANRIADGVMKRVDEGAQTVNRYLDRAEERLTTVLVKSENILNPDLMLDANLERIQHYNELVLETEQNSSIEEYPQVREVFTLDHCRNAHVHTDFFRRWVKYKSGPSLQKIDHLLSHQVLENESGLIAYALEKFPNNDKAIIDILEAMIKAFSFPDADCPRIIELPIQQTEHHSGKVVINGIRTSPQEVFHIAIDEYLSSDGKQVTMVCIPSEGFFPDIVNAWAEKRGSMTLAAYVGRSAVSRVLDAYPGQNILVQAFSRGSAVFDSFSQFIPADQCGRIAVHTFGATQFVLNQRNDSRKFLDAVNYISWKDPIPMPHMFRYSEHVSPALQEQARLRELEGVTPNIPVRIEYVETDGYLGLDHNYNTTYLGAREVSYQRYKNNFANFS